MPTITKLQAQKNPKFINLFIDHQYAFSLPLEEIYRQKLKTGLILTKEQIDHLQKLGDYTKLLDRTIKYISLRPRSEHELTIWLTTKVKLSPESLTFTKIIDKLHQLDLLNDENFTNWWNEQRQTFKPRGPQLLRQELLQKGIDKQLIESVLEKLPSQTDNLRQLAGKKFRQLTGSHSHQITKSQNQTKQRNNEITKLRNFLLRKGFSYSQIKPVIDEILNE